ncbi:MAG: PorT family protein [Flavobacteriales bacterium]|nr:PorT family protein [Flavobacteriales bacterium]
MSKDQHSAQNFDRIFREKLGGHSMAPPAGMWENINANTQDSKQKRSLLWIITNDTTIMLLILLLSIFAFDGSDLSKSLSASESSSVNITKTMESVPQKEHTAMNQSTRLSSENATDTNNERDDAKPSDTEKTQSTSSNADNFIPEIAEDKTNTASSETSSNSVSKQLSSSTSNSGRSATMNVDSNDARTDTDASATDMVSNNSDDNSIEPFATSNDGNTDLTSHEISAGGEATTTVGILNPETQNVFRWKLMKVLPPHLSVQLAEDSLSKVVVPESPKDLIGTRDHEVFAGAHVNFNLPLIFNQNTYGAFDGKELAYKPTFGLASGVRIGYTYKRQYGFQTGFIFYSRQGQDYDDKLNGNVARRQVKLQYFHVPVILRYKFKIKKQQKFESPWVINLGTDIGILRSAEITYNGNEYPLGAIINPEANDKDYFKPIDVSVVLGVEKEIYFTKWLMLSVGMRTTFSGDINAKDHPVQNDGKNYNKSHNFTFGFTLGLNYYLRR